LLDFQNLKVDLAELVGMIGEDRAAERQCCLLLQALRWRISRTPLWEAREKVIQTYVDEDLLHLNGFSGSDFDLPDPAATLVMRLLSCPSELAQEYAVRLFYYIASSVHGRNYFLSVADELIQWLVARLQSRQWKFKTALDEHVLGCLQRLSLSPQHSASILRADDSILEQLFELLAAAQKHSHFANEHASTLLLNLALDPSCGARLGGLEEAAVRAVQRVLADPELDYMHAYLISVLFSALQSPELREIIVTSQGQEPDYVHFFRELTLDASPLEPTGRNQLRYIVQLIDQGNLDSAMQQEEEKRQEEREDAPAEQESKLFNPEVEADEHPKFRQSSVLKTELRGEQLLCYGYPDRQANRVYKEEKEAKAADKDGETSPILPDKKRSPVMRKFNKIPDEMQHKPKIQND